MNIEETKTLIRQAAEAFNNTQDRSGWFDFHHPDVVAHSLAPEPLGLNGLKQFYAELWQAFPDLHIEIEDLIGDGDRVAWRLIVTGTHEGEFKGVSPTGKRVKFAAGYIFRVENGKIVERWTNFDRLGLLVQLGAIPAPV